MNKDLKVYKPPDKPHSGARLLDKAKNRSSSQSKQQSRSPRNRSTTAIKSQILPDIATTNMKQLRSVRFLAQPPKAPEDLTIPQLVDARPVQEKTSKLAHQYLNRPNKQVNSSILKVINQSKVAHLEILKKQEREKELERLAKLNAPKEETNQGISDLLVEDDEPGAPEDQVLAKGFVRSDRNMMMRKKDGIDQEIFNLEQQKTALVQRLNDALLKLDRYNKNTREMSEKLLDQMKFTRDLQKAVGASGQEDLTNIASQQLQKEFDDEKKIGQNLQSQIDLCEEERKQLLEKVQNYQSEKQSIAQEGSDSHQVQVSQVCIKSKLIELQQLASQCQELDLQVQDAHTTLDQLESQLQHQQHIMIQFQVEREQVLDKQTEVQHLYDHKECQTAKIRVQGAEMHKKHVKLMALRNMQESLQGVFTKKYSEGFVEIRRRADVEIRRSKSVKQIKSVFRENQLRKVRKLWAKWTSEVYPGPRVQKLSYAAPYYYKRIDTRAQFYFKWRSHYQDNLKRRQAQTESLNYIFNRSKRNWLRIIQTFFALWKVNSKYDKNRLLTLRKVILRFTDLKKFATLKQWRSQMEDQGFNARMMALQSEFTRKQMQSKILQTLYQLALNKKVKKRSRLLRAFKNLKTAIVRDKYAKHMAKWIEKKGVESEISLCNRPFAKLRLYTQNQKYNRAIETLAILNGKMTSTNSVFCQLTTVWLLNKRKRAMLALVIKPLSGKVAECFQKWKELQSVENWKHNLVLKGLYITAYKRKLKDAMTRWVFNSHQKVLGDQRVTIEGWKTQNHEVGIDNSKTQHQINEKEQIQKYNARSCLKRVDGILDRHSLRDQLRKWYKATQQILRTEVAAQKICDRISLHFKRIAFTKYRKVVAAKRQSILDCRKEGEYRLRLNFRAKKRIYKAIRSYATISQIRIRCMRILMKKVDKHSLKQKVRTWRHFTTLHREHSMFLQEQKDVLFIDKVTVQVGDVSDTKNKIMQQVKGLKKILKTECKHILQKWVLRFHRGGLKYGFKNWKLQTLNMRHQASFALFLKLQLSRNEARAAIHSWKSSMKRQTRKAIETRCVQKEREIHRLTSENTLKQKIADQRQQIIKEKLLKIIQQRDKWTHKNDRIIKWMIDKKQNNIVIRKEKYYLTVWRNYSRDAAKSCQKLNTNIAKILMQQAFNRVMQFNCTDQRQEDLTKNSSKLARIVTRCIERVFLRKWVQSMNSKVKSEIRAIDHVTSAAVQEHGQNLNRIHSHTAEMFAIRRQKKLKYKVMNEWQKLKFQGQVSKEQLKQLEDQIVSSKAKRALMKWSERVRTTQKLRGLQQKFNYHNNIRTLKLCFKKGFQKNQKLEYQMTQNIKRIFTVLKCLQTTTAWQKIKARSEINLEASYRDKQQAMFQMGKVLDKLRTIRYRLGLGRIQHFVVADRASYLKVHNCVMHMVDRYKREAFFKWKHQQLKIDVADYNENWYGPVNLQAWHERAKYIKLRKLVEHDMQDPDNSEQMIKKLNDRELGKMKRAMVRLIVFGDPDLRLMPIYFQRLKQFWQVRKLWKYIIKQANRAGDRSTERFAMNKFFQRWRRNAESYKMELLRMPLYQLKERLYRKALRLRCKLSDQDEVQANLDVIQGERDALFTGFIGSQKLAFALAKANYQRAESKAISRLSDEGNTNLRLRINLALQDNLKRISALKSKINEFEDANLALVDDNDQDKSNAVRIVQQAHEMEHLQNEVDRQAQESKSQNQTIKRLKEDQTWLLDHLKQQEDIKQQMEKQGHVAQHRVEPIERENCSMNSGMYQQCPRTQLQSSNVRNASSPLRRDVR